MSLPSLDATPASDYKFIFGFDTPFTGDIRSMTISDDGRWLMMSSNSPTQKSLILIDAYNFGLHAIIDTGNIWTTSVAWATNTMFFASFSDGRVFCGELVTTKKFMFLILVAVPPPVHAITAVAFDRSLNYLALSMTRKLIVLHHNKHDNFNLVHRVEPFSNSESSIRSLVFYGIGRVNLVVGATAGLA
ncbi:hypothetical protein FRC08_005088 [Ceratobasidium sp. 394]|nr:hypothetical protein FRC08_005088 [Ceratobasidium sp. 394]